MYSRRHRPTSQAAPRRTCPWHETLARPPTLTRSTHWCIDWTPKYAVTDTHTHTHTHTDWLTHTQTGIHTLNTCASNSVTWSCISSLWLVMMFWVSVSHCQVLLLLPAIISRINVWSLPIFMARVREKGVKVCKRNHRFSLLPSGQI